MSLSELEHQLLDYLKARAGEPVSRDTLLRDVWGYASGVSSRTVDVTIQRLRKKVEPDPKSPRLIVTVRGRGYAYGTTGDVSHTAPSTVRPADSGPFEGREDAVAAVRQWLDGRSRLLTLHGPIGIGKSRILARVVSDLPQQSTHYVDLAGASGVSALEEVPRTADIVVVDHVESAHQLLRERIVAWSRARPSVRWLVASRMRLRLADETVLPIGPLMHEHATQVYTAFRAMARPGQPADADMNALGGVPFLLRLAADFPPGVDTADALVRVVGPPDLPARQRTVDAASRTLHLDDDHRRALAVAATLPAPMPTALIDDAATVSELVDAGSVWERTGRVELPLATRVAVGAPADADAVRARYLAWVVDKSPDQLHDQLENVRWALDSATTRHDRVLAAVALAQVDRTRGGRAEQELDALLQSPLTAEQRVQVLRASASVAGSQLDIERCEALLLELMALAEDGVDHRMLVLAKHNLSVLYTWSEQHDKTVALIDVDADRLAETHATDLAGGLWLNRGIAYAALGDASGARSAYNLAMALGGEGDRAHAGHNLAIIDAALGDFDRAEQMLTEHERTVENHPVQWGEAALTHSWVLACMGRTDEAGALAARARARCADTEDSYYLRHAAQVSASIQHAIGDVIGALRAYEALAAEWDDAPMQRSMTLWRAVACAQLGARGRAERLLVNSEMRPGLTRLLHAFLAGEPAPAGWTEGVGFSEILEGRLVERLFDSR